MTHLRMKLGVWLELLICADFTCNYLFCLHTGLYEVTQCTELIMGDGFKVFMFNFVRSPNQPPPPWPNERIELPWLSTEFHHNSSVSPL